MPLASENAIQISVFVQQGRGGFGADSGSTFDVIRCISRHGLKVRILFGINPEFLLEFPRSEYDSSIAAVTSVS